MISRIKTISAIILCAWALTACHHEQPDPAASTASLCRMLKPKVEANNYTTTDPTTMKRKNAVDDAKLVKEYDAYSCPEAVDAAPLP